MSAVAASRDAIAAIADARIAACRADIAIAQLIARTRLDALQPPLAADDRMHVLDRAEMYAKKDELHLRIVQD